MIHEIGGFLGLETYSPSISHLYEHSSSIKLNSARNGILYILRAKKPKKIYIPYYSCNSVLEPILNLQLKFEYYHIDINFRPIFDKFPKADEMLLYINYFGINDEICKELSKSINNLLIDNTQAFFSERIGNIDTVYSPRKFFGVCDGGLLYTNKLLSDNFEKDISYSKYNHILKRIDISANDSYDLFIDSEKSLDNQPIKFMSEITSRILEGINYEKAKLIRERNFLYLHNLLSKINELPIDLKSLNAPLIYPFLFTKKTNLKQELILKKIYIPTYWKEVLEKVNSSSIENKLVNYLVPLPIDQRYNLDDMKYIYENVKSEL